MDKHERTDAEQIAERLRAASRVIIPLHQRPDGDAVGSALALATVLTRWAVPTRCVTVDPLPSSLRFLPRSAQIERGDIGNWSLGGDEIVACLDSPSLHRFSRTSPVPVQTEWIVNIDHHSTNERFGVLNLIMPTVSTTHLLTTWIDTIGEPIDESLALCLLTGIITDTASFWNDVTPEALDIAARLQRAGASYAMIVEHTLRSISREAVRCWTEVLDRLEFDLTRRIVWAVVPQTLLSAHAIPDEDRHVVLVGVLDRIVRDIREADTAFLCAEEGPEQVVVDLRSRQGSTDVGRLARRFGGGGHANAAGFTAAGRGAEVAARVLRELDVR